MAFKCPVPGYEDSEKEFQTEAALKSHIRNAHPNMKEGVRKVPIAEGDFTFAELVWINHIDIAKMPAMVLTTKQLPDRPVL
jgi:hypothetical protein